MNTTRILTALAVIACALPQVGEAQLLSFFGRKDTNKEAIWKAKPHNLVPVSKAVPGAFVDLRYKESSPAKFPLYPSDMPCLVHVSTGKKLRMVNEALREHGYALKIWDAWRPLEAHQMLWEAVRDERFVVPPSKGPSWHCLGISVDVTLVKLDGSEVAMPTEFDAFVPQAASAYRKHDPEVLARLDLLQNTMIRAGFRTIRTEWWHFDDMNVEGQVFLIRASDLGLKMPAPRR